MSESEPDPTDTETVEPTEKSDQLPAPSEVEAIGESEAVYQRDGEGELTPLPPDVIEWEGEPRRVRFYPFPMGDVEKFRELGESVEVNRLCEVMAEKVHTPDRTAEEWADTDPGQFNAILTRLVEIATGEAPSSEFHAEVRSELEARGGAGGN